jgi:hypothetical protein
VLSVFIAVSIHGTRKWPPTTSAATAPPIISNFRRRLDTGVAAVDGACSTWSAAAVDSVGATSCAGGFAPGGASTQPVRFKPVPLGRFCKSCSRLLALLLPSLDDRLPRSDWAIDWFSLEPKSVPSIDFNWAVLSEV